MKNRTRKDEENRARIDESKSIAMKKKKKNLKRLGGGGLSLEAFANAKSRSNDYNPALLKKQREFYKNAKYVSKYKKSLKQQSRQNDSSSVMEPVKELQDENGTEDVGKTSERRYKGKKKGLASLGRVYEKKHQEKEKERIEMETIMQAKNEEREQAKTRRKSLREKMLKKTQKGQPVMKYRIEHLLATIQGSTKN